MNTADIVKRLKAICASYAFEPVAIFKTSGKHPWPLVANDEADLESQLLEGEHFLPLPREPAALANVIEVAIVDFVQAALDATKIEVTRGTERGYPDIELEVGGDFYAVDVKVARRNLNKKGVPTGRTDSRITLYTGNTFFKFPTLKWPGTFRPFADYAGHIDLIALYTLDVVSPTRVTDFELVVVEPWRIASKQRSSTTREYLGAVDNIQRIRDEKGEFATAADFYAFWRKHPWKIGKAVANQLSKLLAASAKGP